MLAGLLRAPSRFAPTNDLARAQARAGIIVGLMEEQGYLTAAQAREARAQPGGAVGGGGGAGRRRLRRLGDVVGAGLPDPAHHRGRRGADHLRPAASSAPPRPGWPRSSSSKVKAGSNAQAAIVVMSPDGAVRAMVGGRDFGAGEGQFNRATQAQRQTGSLFKTFVYAAALQAGASPLDPVLDAPLTLYIPGSGDWTPQNYTREYLGQITLAAGAGAVDQHRDGAGLRGDRARAGARRWRRTSASPAPIADGPAMALGVSEATLLEMTGAYAGILNRGRQRPALRAARAAAQGGRRAADAGRPAPAPVRVLDERAAGELVWMMTPGDRGRHRRAGRGCRTAGRRPARPAPPRPRATPGSSASPPTTSPASGWATTTTRR